MAGQLITLPWRLGFQVTRTALGLTGRALGLATQVVQGATSRRPESTEANRPPEREPERDSAERGGSSRERAAATGNGASAGNGAGGGLADRRVAPPPPPDPVAHAAEVLESGPDDAPPVSAEPTGGPSPHVSEDATLVESFAEPGAEDGAGAQVTVEEPWPDYGELPAREVISRLSDASPEELAAVELYERAHRGRETVLSAVARQLKN